MHYILALSGCANGTLSMLLLWQLAAAPHRPMVALARATTASFSVNWQSYIFISKEIRTLCKFKEVVLNLSAEVNNASILL